MVTWNPGGGQGAVVDSLFDVFFTVDAKATYLLSGKLTNDAPDLNSITTLSATLLDTTSETVLLFGVGAMCVAGWYIRRDTGGTLTGCQP
jgi:hypothetical protein